jgi:hypothetical protein
MKRLLAVLMLILCLSFPVLAGHQQIGGAYCVCGAPDCICDPGEVPMYQTTSSFESGTLSDPASELAIAILALLFWLRLKAQ